MLIKEIFSSQIETGLVKHLLSSTPGAGAGAHLTEQAPGGRSSTHYFSSYPRQTFWISYFPSLNIIAIMLKHQKSVHYKNIFAFLLYELHENMFGLVKQTQFSSRFAVPVDSLLPWIANFCRTKAPGIRKVFLPSLIAIWFNLPSNLPVCRVLKSLVLFSLQRILPFFL